MKNLDNLSFKEITELGKLMTDERFRKNTALLKSLLTDGEIMYVKRYTIYGEVGYADGPYHTIGRIDSEFTLNRTEKSFFITGLNGMKSSIVHNKYEYDIIPADPDRSLYKLFLLVEHMIREL